MLPKINLYACLTACVLYFFTWFAFPVPAERTIYQLSGIGICYSGFTRVREDAITLSGHTSSVSPLMLLALIATGIAAVQAFVAFREGRLSLRVGLFTGVALACILCQAKLGPPVLGDLDLKTSTIGSGELFGLPASQILGRAEGNLIPTRAYYLEIAALAVPALLMLDGLLNTLKRRR